MFCKKCGKEMPDDTKFCPVCGEPVNSVNLKDLGQGAVNAANSAFNDAENELRTAAQDVANGFSGNTGTYNANNGNNGGSYMGGRLKEDRSIWMYILLSIVTCGIYSLYFLYKLIQDVNIAMAGDGEETAGLVKYILLSVITCGIYGWYWQYCLGNRLANNAPRYGMNFQENGTTILLWTVLGSFLCGLGPIIAWSIIIKNTNAICAGYNRSNGL
ncbi:hypothetical protein BXO88_06525 [Oribacterium sp. C9]|uniref:DUF4234 domain-containing protein n=1 Tax=Oribacterium sp. C9 TaxID=1943579 RepID=UPI00099000D9|nr:DUF4234 domain-containing protein [Oribacterium sp. C9]OON86646.1 hypothetical protein BXO88_06525 [Oribacterium sp. C9]